MIISISVTVVTIAVIIIILIIILVFKVIIIVAITEYWDPVRVSDLQCCKDAEAVQMGHVRVLSSQLCWVTRLSTFRRHSTDHYAIASCTVTIE